MWVRFQGNTHTDNTNIDPECTVSQLWIKVSAKCINLNTIFIVIYIKSNEELKKTNIIKFNSSI